MSNCSVDHYLSTEESVSTSGILCLNETFTTSPSSRPVRRANLEVAKYLAIALAVLSTYTLLALLIHFIKKKLPWRKSIATILCLLSAVCSFILSLNKLSELWIGSINCAFYHMTATSLYGAGLGLVYTTLWLRQRKLYSDHRLVHTVSKVSRVVSATVIVLIYFLLVFIFASFVTVLQFEQAYPPCHIVWYPLSSLILPLVIFFITSCFLLQLVMFLLMLNPLRRDRASRCEVLCSPSRNDIHRMLKRLAICACLCVLSTILLSIAILLDAVEIICIYWGNLVSLDLLSNTLATTCSFVDWSQRLFPLLPLLNKKRKMSLRKNSVVLEETSERTKQTSISFAETTHMMNGNNKTCV